MPKYILASQSPRRKQLLEWAEIDFEVVVHAIKESYSTPLIPEEVAKSIAQQKANAVSNASEEGRVIIAADTIVVLNNKIIGKPKNIQDAINTLTALSGNIHHVITGVTITNGKKEHTFSDITEVEFHMLTQQQIKFYVNKYQPFDKAGAYAIQEWIGVVGIKRINGDFYNVMGLPVSRVVQILKEFTPSP
ncbi:MAG: Maf family nucleotide pyrophosphatase [Chitinophagaceae bacterium]